MDDVPPIYRWMQFTSALTIALSLCWAFLLLSALPGLVPIGTFFLIFFGLTVQSAFHVFFVGLPAFFIYKKHGLLTPLQGIFLYWIALLVLIVEFVAIFCFPTTNMS